MALAMCHTTRTPIFVGANWMVGEYRECTISADKNSDLDFLFCENIMAVRRKSGSTYVANHILGKNIEARNGTTAEFHQELGTALPAQNGIRLLVGQKLKQEIITA